jgi:hypothetical protein
MRLENGVYGMILLRVVVVVVVAMARLCFGIEIERECFGGQGGACGLQRINGVGIPHLPHLS